MTEIVNSYLLSHKLEHIELPASVTTIAQDFLTPLRWNEITIITPAGSYAESWARSMGARVITK